MSISSMALTLHERHKGKIEITPKVAIKSKRDLSLTYTPGVAAVCKAIAANTYLSYRYTIRQNSVAVISDGSAVLGLGNIGPEAAIPVMEGKCLLMKSLANIDAFPLCLDTNTPDEIINTVKSIAPVFGAINLEDIAAPKCFEIESKLKALLNIPVMHDDQHATAVVVLAGMINALKVTKKTKQNVKIVISGAGAAAIATAKMFLTYGFRDIILADSKGALLKGRSHMNPYKMEIASLTNKSKLKGILSDVIKGSDVFIGLSAPNILTKSMVKTMNKSPIIFAMANPIPEIMPNIARQAGAAVVATGRSDFPNQINNSLAFPGILRGALDARATEINEQMKLQAANALASLVKNPTKNKIISDPLDKAIVRAISTAVEKAAIKTKVCRKL